jgi:hypothetical protein
MSDGHTTITVSEQGKEILEGRKPAGVGWEDWLLEATEDSQDTGGVCCLEDVDGDELQDLTADALEANEDRLKRLLTEEAAEDVADAVAEEVADRTAERVRGEVEDLLRDFIR